ncbi:MAG: polyprenyl synthetase family protein [Candidatus Krumholzibacteriia bacterium]
MGPDEVRAALAREKRGMDQLLRRLLAEQAGVPRRLRQAMAHSLLGGGKRLRPVLLLWTYDAVVQEHRRPRGDREAAARAGAALELIHTYSLIHDDLPAMDDDVLRRGRPTCHVAFDEATAILAGDGLQALAFGVLGRLGPVGGDLVALLADAAGPAGMVGGQQDDLDAEHETVSAARVKRIHRRKTAALLSAALAGGAHLGGADRALRERLAEAGEWLGLAFQGADDLLDTTATAEQLGKSPGKDAAAGKATFVRVEGLARARRRTHRYGERGRTGLEESLPAGPARERLVGLADLMWQRES